MMEQITSRDGTQIGVWQSGSGAPLLLVHGTTADHSRWKPILPGLDKHFTVYTMDRRGRGGSGDAPAYDLQREAEDITAVVESIGGPTFVLGHSYGALCSLEAALLTDKISRLVLYEPPVPTGIPPFPGDVPTRIQAQIDRGDFEAALEIFFREVVRMPEHELAKYRQLPVWQTRIALAPTIAREMIHQSSYNFDAAKFASLRVPTLFLLGGDSPPLFQQAAELVDATLPNCQLVILAGQQHIAMDMAPEQFISQILGFLQA